MQKKSLKVLHCIKAFSELTETFVYNQIIGLDRIGIDNYIATEKRLHEKERPYPYTKVFEIPNTKKAPFFIRKYHRYVKKDKKLDFKYKINYQEWENLLFKLDPDLIHCHFGQAAHLIYHILDKLDVTFPLLVSLHGTDTLWEPKRNSHYKSALASLSTKHKCLFTCPSSFLLNKALNSFKIPIEQLYKVPNGFSSDFISFCNHYKNRQSQNVFSIINIGRFVRFKGQYYLIKAFERFLKTVTEKARLTLVGTGDEGDYLSELVNQLGIGDKVNFVENIPNKQIPFILQQHDLYVHPSISDPVTEQAESFGVSILEAVAVGLPVIVTDSGGMPDTILGGDGKTAIIVPEKNVSELFEAIKSVFHNYAGIDRSLRQDIINKYNNSNNINSIYNIYQKLIR